MADKSINIGHFQAKYLWPLLPFVEYARTVHPLRFTNGCIGMEPCAEGGAYLYAVTAPALVVIRDPEARVSGPVILDIPDAAFHAAKPLKMPRLNYCDQFYTPPTPEWALPGDVYVYDAGIHITTKMRHPQWAESEDEFQPALYARTASHKNHVCGLGYRLKPGRVADWRVPLTDAYGAVRSTASTSYFNPQIPALFVGIMDMMATDLALGAPAITFTTRCTNLLRFHGHPDVVCLWSGMRPPDAGPHEIPAHFFERPDEAPHAD